MTTGYEIHHGVAALTVPGAAQPFLDGYRLGAVWGTTWRGAWKRDGFRRAFLRDVADLAGRDFAPAPDVELAAVRAAVRSTWTRSGTWSPITWTSR